MTIEISEDAIAACCEKLAGEIIDNTYTTINGKRVSIHDLLEDADPEDLANIAAMLLVDKDNAYDHDVGIIKRRFYALFSDAEIEAHLMAEAEDLALERHLEEEYEYEH
jgi:hypothetical protein